MLPRARLVRSLCTALVLLLAGVATAAAAVFNPKTFQLANGMQVVVVENRRVPVVTHMVWYRVGAIDEPEGRSGLAHLLEHLMFKGTQTRGPGEFSALVTRHGGQENAFTSHDVTAFFQNIAREHLGLMMELESDRMRHLVLSEDVVANERQVVLEERHQRVDNDPAALLAEQASAVQFFNTNYRRPVIGWEQEIRALTKDDVVAFYRRWYHPANAVLVVAGDVSADEVRALAERTYGQLSPQPLPTRAVLEEPAQTAARRVVLVDKRVQHPAWQRSYLAPSLLTADAELAIPLQVLAEIVGGGKSGRLHRELVLERGLAASAGAGYDPVRRGPSRFVIAVSPRPGIEAAMVEAAVDGLLARLRADGIEEAELERAKTRMLAEAIYARDSLTTGARLLGEAVAIGLGVEAVEGWPEQIRAVTKGEIDAAARSVLVAGRSVTALLLPDDQDRAREGQ